MKALKFLMIAALAAGSIHIHAQQTQTDESGMVIIDHSKDDFKTILGDGASHGGYISFDMLAGQTSDHQNLMEMGGRLGWIMNHGFTFGIAGYGLVGNNSVDVTYTDPVSSVPVGIESNYRLGGGYGGLFIEPIVGAKQPVHVSFPILFGVGGIGYYSPFNQDNWDYEYGAVETDVITVIKPGVDLEFNITRFFRLALSANYRFVNNLELTLNETTDTQLPSNYLNGFNYGFSLKFGWF